MELSFLPTSDQIQIKQRLREDYAHSTSDDGQFIMNNFFVRWNKVESQFGYAINVIIDDASNANISDIRLQ